MKEGKKERRTKLKIRHRQKVRLENYVSDLWFREKEKKNPVRIK